MHLYPHAPCTRRHPHTYTHMHVHGLWHRPPVGQGPPAVWTKNWQNKARCSPVKLFADTQLCQGASSSLVCVYVCVGVLCGPLLTWHPIWTRQFSASPLPDLVLGGLLGNGTEALFPRQSRLGYHGKSRGDRKGVQGGKEASWSAQPGPLDSKAVSSLHPTELPCFLITQVLEEAGVLL